MLAEREISKSETKLENEFVDRLMYVFKAPTIVWPGLESTIDSDMLAKVKLYRLIQTVQMSQGIEVDEVSDYEAVLYLMTASLANPPSHTWSKIYGHLFRKISPQNTHLIEGLEEPQTYELAQLHDFKRWIYRQQMQQIKQKLKEQRKEQKEEKPVPAVVAQQYKQASLPF